MEPALLDEVVCEPTPLMPPAPGPQWHRPVLVDEVVRWLQPHPEAVIVDATVGTGGHSAAVLPHLVPDGRLIAIDRDATALAQAQARLREFAPMVRWVHGNYRELPQLLERVHVTAADGLLLDLGVSSLQLDAPERGFSFLSEGPLDMRMDDRQALTAQTLVMTSSADELARILERYGEERHAGRIARRIVQERQRRPITTTAQLARLVVSALPARARHGRLHAATRTFQALRIAVNDECGALDALLRRLDDVLKPGGRAVIVTFESLEDRLVKQAFRAGADRGAWRVLTKKPVRPSSLEVAQNRRARSAKLRAAERLA